jgi:hypothetical protein
MDNQHEEHKIESQIKSMLETVLKEDNEEQDVVDEMSTLNLDDTLPSFIPRSNKKSITANNPKISSQGYLDLNSEPYTQRGLQKKFNTVDMSPSHQGHWSQNFKNSLLMTNNVGNINNMMYFNKNVNLVPKDFQKNLPQQEYSNYNTKMSMMGMNQMNNMINTNPFNNNMFTYDNMMKSQTPILGKGRNEVEELIEGVLNKIDYINDEIYYKVQGRFYAFLKNQIGSRLLQRSLINTNLNIISKILFEVRINIYPR